MVKPVADKVRGPSSLPGGLSQANNREANTGSLATPLAAPQPPAATLEKSRPRTGVETVAPTTLTIPLGRAGSATAGVSAKHPLDLANVKGAIVKGAEAVVTAALGVGSAHAAADDWVARTTTVVDSSVVRDGKANAVNLMTRLKEHDVISTGANGQMSMTFNDGSTLSMGPDTEIRLSMYSYDPTAYVGAYDAVVNRGSITVRDANGVEHHFESASPKSKP